MTPAQMAAKSVGKPGWGLTPYPVVAITPNHGHQNGQRLYYRWRNVGAQTTLWIKNWRCLLAAQEPFQGRRAQAHTRRRKAMEGSKRLRTHKADDGQQPLWSMA